MHIVMSKLIRCRRFSCQTLLLVITIASCCLAKQSFASQRACPECSFRTLPGLVITYAVTAAYYEDFKGAWERPDASCFLTKLYAEFEDLSCNISVRMVFTHTTFIVQNEIPGHFSGEIPASYEIAEQHPVPGESILFVSTPLESWANRVLVILSSVSPERTTIMTVDSALNVSLLYDSYSIDSPEQSMCALFAIRTVTPGQFELFERDSGRCAPFGSKRTFLLDLTSGEVNITNRGTWEELKFPTSP